MFQKQKQKKRRPVFENIWMIKNTLQPPGVLRSLIFESVNEEFEENEWEEAQSKDNLTRN